MVSQCSASSFLQSPIQYSADILQFSNGTIYKIMVDVGWRMDMMVKLKNFPPPTALQAGHMHPLIFSALA